MEKILKLNEIDCITEKINPKEDLERLLENYDLIYEGEDIKIICKVLYKNQLQLLVKKGEITKITSTSDRPKGELEFMDFQFERIKVNLNGVNYDISYKT